MKSRTGEVCLSPGMTYWSVIQPELVVEHTRVGVVVTVSPTQGRAHEAAMRLGYEDNAESAPFVWVRIWHL